MAVATHSPTKTEPAAHGSPETHAHVRIAPVTPGKVAMWLFLATEVMFFTGLIGSYIVLHRQHAQRLQQSLSSDDFAQRAGEHSWHLAQVGRW